ncbi:uroporphyrinogen-III synthase [Palleronia salina]|uniref:Uroporphyrinogen-III synthase n=1 Tax=Palleronia salina TaxID=313368 RepID=A0A1M6D3D5_9RHOB|nr:uroporphyrinogen-III synthase [Palleronia salina]SHI67760.1 uroporphyrinogen-III synthase [Palleronia salina]
MRGLGFGGPILFAPVLEIVPMAPGDLPGGDLVFTSEHGAIRAAELCLRDRRAFAVGPRTGAVARALGFDCADGPGQAAELPDWLATQGAGPVLHLHGRHVTGDLAGALRELGVLAEARVVYDQVARAPGAAATRAARGPGAILPLFSARTARLLADGLEQVDDSAQVLSISSAVARAWPLGGVQHIASTPDAAGMAALVAALVAPAVER